MKTIGLLGGMSWESTLPYYRILNETVAQRLGGLHSARIVLDSVDFHEIAHLQHAGRWTEAGEILAVTGDVDTGQHDFSIAVGHQPPHMRQDVHDRQ